MNRDDLRLGIFHGMASEDYHATPALGASGLKKLARSPHHFYSATLDPNRPPQKTTPAMIAGTAAHCALLEPQHFESRYIVKPPGQDGRTKEGKVWLASVPPGAVVLDADAEQTCKRQAAAIRALPEVAALMERGDAEVSAFWIDDATGELCKCRPDFVSQAGDNGVILLDAKTTQDASPAGFPRSIANYGYHLQAAWYSDGFERASGLPVLGFVFACVESEWPHAAAAYMLDDDTLTKARVENRRLLEIYAECMRSGTWPGYSRAIELLRLPPWAFSTTTIESTE